MEKKQILIFDDDQTIGESLRYLFAKQAWESRYIGNPLNAIDLIETYKPNLVLLDLNFRVGTDGGEGLLLLEKIKAAFPQLPIILFTAWGSMELAIAGMKRGAADFITKPWDNQHLIAAIRTQLELNQTAKQPLQHSSLDALVGESEALHKIKERITRVAPTSATVLITGESGTGKELVAQAIHQLSSRSKQPFVSLNLGAIPNALFESELFGHKKGAFTSAIADRDGRFKLAEKGTLFLDEIGDLPLASQVKLLRVLEERTFEPLGGSQVHKTDVRIVSATHRDLSEMVIQQRFREDLYYRINLLHIHLPALRERTSDIPLLVNHFVSRFASEHGKQAKVTPAALAWFQKQLFPGNIRQLKNCVERSLLLSDNSHLGISDFKPHLEPIMQAQQGFPKVGELTLEEMEIKLLRNALDFYKGNISDAARSLGITRSALYRRIEKHNLTDER